MPCFIRFNRWLLPNIKPYSEVSADRFFPRLRPIRCRSIPVSERAMHSHASAFVTPIPDCVEHPRPAFTKHKHIFKVLVVPIAIRKSTTILFPYHRIVQVETNVLEVKGLPKRCSRLTSLNRCIINNPHNHPPLTVTLSNSCAIRLKSNV